MSAKENHEILDGVVKNPIRLVKTNVITRTGYYECIISDFIYKEHEGRPLLVFTFLVTKGKCKGFQLSAGFYYLEPKGKMRLSYLCEAVGITGQLDDPKILVGKHIRLRVVPGTAKSGWKTYRNYYVTRFHGVGMR